MPDFSEVTALQEQLYQALASDLRGRAEVLRVMWSAERRESSDARARASTAEAGLQVAATPVPQPTFGEVLRGPGSRPAVSGSASAEPSTINQRPTVAPQHRPWERHSRTLRCLRDKDGIILTLKLNT
ncbi:uncharacterized protein LOC144116124 [Amblyomma americanum]